MINGEVRTSWKSKLEFLRNPQYSTYKNISLITFHPAASPLYCNPSCCPPARQLPSSSSATLQLASYYNSQASTHRADYNMVDQEAFDDNATTASDNSRAVNTAADLAKLRNAGKPLSSQELKELNNRIKAFEEMARMEDRLKALESRKRPRSQESSDLTLPPEATTRVSEAPLPSRGSSSRHQTHTHSPTDDSDSSSSTTVTHHRHKRPRYTKGIKVTPSYTLKVSSSLREWGDWKKDIERVFEGDPYTYRTGS